MEIQPLQIHLNHKDMKETIDTLGQLTQILNWQVTTLIIILIVRKHLGPVFLGFQSLLNRTTKVVVDGKTFTFEAAAEIIKEQKQEIAQEKKEKQDIKKELDDYSNGAIQTLPKNLVADNIERLEPIIKSMGMEAMSNTKEISDFPNDPEKGKWGGKSLNNDKRITASVIPFENNNNLFKITLAVYSVNSAKQLTGKVTFHLHPTFINPERRIEAENGIAKLNMIAYGSFTVGVQTEDGTKLELDLSEDKSFPEVFRNN